ncbi:MAG: AbrB family transcriptional regulator [Sulfitobacter sp.]|nr:AbrB family transcriptional regulator [Sulfitobacter sp.]
MRGPAKTLSVMLTLRTLAVAGIGALLAWGLNTPVYMLLGPALAVSLASLGGLRSAVDPRLRDICFVVLGVAVGTGFDRDALGTMLRWPMAFLFMAGVIWAIVILCRIMLVRFFRFDARSAILAAAPGHLSFVIAAAGETGSDVARISITQSVRLLCLTLIVPFVALAMGLEVSGNIAPQGDPMSLPLMVGVFAVAVLVGLLFRRLSVPAPLLMGAMVCSALAQLTGVSPGVLPSWLVLPAYLTLGALIGTRFSGMTPAHLTSGLAAGLAITGVATVLAGAGAVPVAWALDMPVAHVLIAFAPGGFETMIAMGAVLGVVPGFVAACHMARLLVLTVLLPAMLAREARQDQSVSRLSGTP